MINLAKNFNLTPPQLTLLNRGLTFIPTRGSNKNIIEQTRWDLQLYHRKIKLATYFQNAKDTIPPPFTPKSDWTPPDGKLPPEITALIRTDIQHVDTKFQVSYTRPNLSREETEALKELKNNRKIIIKPADKGSAVVILDREQYLWEGYRQLNDKHYYLKLIKPIYTDTKPMIEKIVQTLQDKKFINAKQKQYLLGDPEPRARLFYMLPKIHKDPSKWSKPHEIPPGRPIVSDCSSETYHTAEFLDFYLNPLSTLHPSYIKDTYDFVEKIKKLHIPKNATLFTMDIDSLYINIDIPQGIQAIKNIFHKYPNKNRPDKELIQLLEINLTRNDFEFNGEFFLQIKGTAMGKKFAPAYANIFMAEWETSALASCIKKPLYYYRYLDDIWGVWQHSEEDFDHFLITLNNHNESIKLKSTTSRTSVDFLDTTTYKGQDFQSTNNLDIKAFFKETDTHALLHKSSHHPKHTYAGLVKSQLLRFHRICTQREDFRQATTTLFSALCTRGYSRSFLRKSLKTFLETKPQVVSTILPFIITYSASAVRLVRVIKTNFQKALSGTQILQEHRIVAALKKNRNLQDYLVKAKVSPLLTLRPRGQGEFFKHQTWLRSKYNKNVFKTLTWGNIQSKNCVYLITCTQCGLQYVGETKNSITVRFTQHKYNILRQKKTHTPLVRHFLQHGWHSVQATVLQTNPKWTGGQRRRAERVWISKMDTIYPRGLNEK